MLATVVVLLALTAGVAADRQTYLLDNSFVFYLEPILSVCPSAINITFPFPIDGKQCMGLSSASAASYEECANACCAATDCDVFQWCGVNGTDCAPVTSCWIGTVDDCDHSANGWQSRSRTPQSPPQPGDPCAVNECASNTDDSSWRAVFIPHDFVVEGNFTSTADVGHGYLPGGIGWYRSHFDQPTLTNTTAVWLDFDGIQAVSYVWLNDVFLGSHSSGYTPSRYFLNTTMLRTKNNVLAVKADAIAWDGWWYDGGGIYRHVWLRSVETNGPYLGPDGIYVPSNITGAITWKADGRPYADASVLPSVEVWSNVSTAVAFTVEADVVDASGVVVAKTAGSGTVDSSKIVVWNVPVMELTQAQLWHALPAPATPALYFFNVRLYDASGELLDSQSVRFGIRQTAWDATSGFYLNGVATKIQGMANHQDFAGVGVAVPDHLQWYRMGKLRDMGANGWRTAHNPPTPALLDAADDLGFLVWDENHRNGEDIEAATMVRRDRNHPSIIIWSICNEVLCNSANPVDDALRLKQLIKSHDPMGGRVVSANNYNNWIGPDTPLDVIGYDYFPECYDLWHSKTSNIPSLGSEVTSCVNDRDEYVNDPVTAHVSGYDINYPVGWGQTAEMSWGSVNETEICPYSLWDRERRNAQQDPSNPGILSRAFIAGGFAWTGLDYKGEPWPYQWPNINSHFGTIDIAGFPKDRFFWYQAWFVHDNATRLYLFPHWNWDSAAEAPVASIAAAESSTLSAQVDSGNRRGAAGAKQWGKLSRSTTRLAAAEQGNSIAVWAYSNADEVELILNGKSLGRQTMIQYWHTQWDVPYTAGTLQAVAYKNGIAVAEAWRNTTGPSAGLHMYVQDGFGASLLAKCQDVALVAVAVIDSAGQRVPTDSTTVVTFEVSGTDGILLGTGNGDPSCHVNDKSPARNVYHGLVMAIVQGGVQTGSILVTATAEIAGVGTVQDQLKIPVVQAVESKPWCHNNYL